MRTLTFLPMSSAAVQPKTRCTESLTDWMMPALSMVTIGSSVAARTALYGTDFAEVLATRAAGREVSGLLVARAGCRVRPPSFSHRASALSNGLWGGSGPRFDDLLFFAREGRATAVRAAVLAILDGLVLSVGSERFTTKCMRFGIRRVYYLLDAGGRRFTRASQAGAMSNNV